VDIEEVVGYARSFGGWGEVTSHWGAGRRGAMPGAGESGTDGR
jgi:hypothetical protein